MCVDRALGRPSGVERQSGGGADAAARPKVSLIVCTRNRSSQLQQLFAHVSRLEEPPGGWELIVVDNGSTDETPRIVHHFADSAHVDVRYVQAPVPGLARARNMGIAASAGDLLVFTDDDCYPQPDFLRAMVAVFERHRVGFIGGRVILYDSTDTVMTVKESTTPCDIAPYAYVRPGLIHGANMAVSMDLVRAVGGFDPHLGAGTPCIAGEDTEFFARAVWAGWRGRYDPGPVVAHHHGRKPGSDARRHFEGYDYGRGAYFLKLLLAPSSRWTYAKYWYRRLRRRIAEGDFLGPYREFVGAARYVVSRILHAERVPLFSEDRQPC
jgi:glycosyltransferase involved in cell wall biosynthesis